MPRTTRFVFSFDDRSVVTLHQLTERGRFSTKGETVRESLHVSYAIQSQAFEGFTEVLVRNPRTKETRVLVIPALYPAADKTK